MAALDTGDHRPGPGRPVLLAGSLLFVLALLVSIAGGIGAGLLALGLVGLGAAAPAVVRRRVHGFAGAGRRASLAVAGTGVAAVAVGTALSPPPPDAAVRTAAPTAAAATPTSAPAAAGTSSAPAPAPTATHTLPARTGTATPVRRAAPTLAMSCPRGGTVASAVFGRRIRAAGPYTVAIDYGDGTTSSGDGAHLRAIFAHTYQVAGTYTVTALLTDAGNQVASATCTYSWTSPAPAP